MECPVNIPEYTPCKLLCFTKHAPLPSSIAINIILHGVLLIDTLYYAHQAARVHTHWTYLKADCRRVKYVPTFTQGTYYLVS